MTRKMVAALAAMTLLAGPAQAGLATDGSKSKSCTIEPVHAEAEPEWTQVLGTSMRKLIATGSFEIKAAYRVNICERDFTVYVLQDRGSTTVYECPVDDTYRPVTSCSSLDVFEESR